jgi:hypothetical protein|tara:strand:+ start:4032 stop:4226 length:195 start_codon:yes stop_codon:yes gene_type:complete
MDKKLKTRVRNWIKKTAELGKELDSLDREAKKADFSQGQRQLGFVKEDYRDFFNGVKRLYQVVK